MSVAAIVRTLNSAVFLLYLAFGITNISAQVGSPWGSYPNRPLALVDVVPPDGRRFSLTHDFDYIDPSGRRWHAPSGLVTDGASIPFPFWSVIGGPYEGLYREAAMVHDAACCAQTERWEDVHHMFYNAMRCSGVSWPKAKTMFCAVSLGGPRWTKLNTSMPTACVMRSPIETAVQKKLVGVIQRRVLSPAETRAVARPFFTNRKMTQTAAMKFVVGLKHRRVTPEEASAISLSVAQSEQFSETDVKQIESWIKKENPSLNTIKSRAEETRKQKRRQQVENAKLKSNSKPRLFPDLPELARQSFDNF
jgi:hypothetical protein